MKKKFSVFALLVLVLSMVSCTKEWTCECTSTSNNAVIGSGSKTSEKVTKTEAKDWCNGFDRTYSNNGFQATTDCEIK